jgi:hypothetical protein
LIEVVGDTALRLGNVIAEVWFAILGTKLLLLKRLQFIVQVCNTFLSLGHLADWSGAGCSKDGLELTTQLLHLVPEVTRTPGEHEGGSAIELKIFPQSADLSVVAAMTRYALEVAVGEFSDAALY